MLIPVINTFNVYFSRLIVECVLVYVWVWGMYMNLFYWSINAIDFYHFKENVEKQQQQQQ